LKLRSPCRSSYQPNPVKILQLALTTTKPIRLSSIKMISFQANLESFDFNHWSYHVPVPDDIAAQMMDGNHRRVKVKFETLGPFPMALMKSKEYWYILVNQEIRKKLGIDSGHKVMVEIERDHSEYGHEVPEEFSVLLDQDKAGCAYFKALTPGKQRSLIYIVSKVKNPESRMKKSLAILHHLRLAKGSLDFKQLNDIIKYYNNL